MACFSELEFRLFGANEPGGTTLHGEGAGKGGVATDSPGVVKFFEEISDGLGRAETGVLLVIPEKDDIGGAAEKEGTGIGGIGMEKLGSGFPCVTKALNDSIRPVAPVHLRFMILRDEIKLTLDREGG